LEFVDKLHSICKKFVIGIDEAKELSKINLVSAKDICDEQGQTYDSLENLSESKSHEQARIESMFRFVNLGYYVYPYGVGVEGVFTLADFFAVRKDGRKVFVEVLADGNVNEATLTKKAQLQKYAELCFVFLTGSKIADHWNIQAQKSEVEQWADVLYCKYGRGNVSLINRKNVSINYDTTRDKGIVVNASFEKTGRKLEIILQFATHFYNKGNPPQTATYETILLSVFKQMQHHPTRQIKYRSLSASKDIALRTMRQKSGLTMIENEKVVIRLKSDYRGELDEYNKDWRKAYNPSQTDLPVDNFYCIVTLEKTGLQGFKDLIQALEKNNIKLDYDEQEMISIREFLHKQKIISTDLLPNGIQRKVASPPKPKFMFRRIRRVS
jgi:hypothetical protein